jgi:Tfp pilus assembly protein PilO
MSAHAGNRERATHLVIAVSVVIGGYVFLVEPQQKRFDELDARIEHLREQASETSPTDAPRRDLSQRVAQLRSVAREVERGNEAHGDATALYEHLTALARERRIELGPFSPKQREGAKDRPAALSLRIIATGSYGDLADFTDAVQHEAGFSRIVEYNVRPIGDTSNPIVRATMQVEFLHFDMPDALVSFLEARHGGT